MATITDISTKKTDTWGKLIAFEGPDFSGKDTQAALLIKKLTNLGYKVGSFKFPNYETPTGKAIKKFLNGQIILNADAFQALQVANKYEMQEEIINAAMDNDFVILNRWFQSAIVYGAAHGASQDFLFSSAIHYIKPNLTIFLDVTPEDTRLRKRDEGRDVYESDEQLINMVYDNYLQTNEFFKTNYGMKYLEIDGTQPIGPIMRQVEEAVLQLIKEEN